MPAPQNYCTWCRRHGEWSIFNGGHLRICRFYRCKSCNICDGNAQSSKAALPKDVSGFCRRCGNHGMQVLDKPWHATNCRYGACPCTRCMGFCVFCMFHDIEKYDHRQHSQACKFRGSCLCSRCAGERRRMGVDLKESPTKAAQEAENKKEKTVTDETRVIEPGRTSATTIKNVPPSQSSACFRELCVFCKLHGQEKEDNGQHAQFCKLRNQCPCGLCLGERRRQGLVVKDSSAEVENLIATDQPRQIEQGKTQAEEIKNVRNVSSSQPSGCRSSGSRPLCVFCKFHDQEKFDVGMHAKFCKFRGECACSCCVEERQRLGLDAKDSSAKAEKPAEEKPEEPTVDQPRCSQQKAQASLHTTKTDTSKTKNQPALQTADKRKGDRIVLPEPKRAHIERKPYCLYCLNHGWQFPMKSHHVLVCMYRNCRCFACRTVRSELKALKTCNYTFSPPKKSVAVAPPNPRTVPNQSLMNSEKSANEPTLGEKASSVKPALKDSAFKSDTNTAEEPAPTVKLDKSAPTCEARNVSVSLHTAEQSTSDKIDNHIVPKAKKMLKDSSLQENLNGEGLPEEEAAETTMREKAAVCEVVVVNGEDFAVVDEVGADTSSDEISSSQETLPDLSTSNSNTILSHDLAKQTPFKDEEVNECPAGSSLEHALNSVAGLKEISDINPNLNGTSAFCTKPQGDTTSTDRVVRESGESRGDLSDIPGTRMTGSLRNAEVVDCTMKHSTNLGSTQKTDIAGDGHHGTIEKGNEDALLIISKAKQSDNSIGEDLEKRKSASGPLFTKISDEREVPSASSLLSLAINEVVGTFYKSPAEEDGRASNEDNAQGVKDNGKEIQARAASIVDDVGNVLGSAIGVSEIDGTSLSTKPSTVDGKTPNESTAKMEGEECGTEKETRGSTSSPTVVEVSSEVSPAASDVLNEVDGTLSTKPPTEDRKMSNEDLAHEVEEKFETERGIQASCPSPIVDEASNVASSITTDVLSEVDGTFYTNPSTVDGNPPIEGISQGDVEKCGTEKEIQGRTLTPTVVEVRNEVPPPASKTGYEKTQSEASAQRGAEECDPVKEIQALTAPPSRELSNVAPPASADCFDKASSKLCAEDSAKTSTNPTSEHHGKGTPECSTENVSEIESQTPGDKPSAEQCEIASLLNELAEFGKNLRPYERYARSANLGNLFTNLPEKPKAPEKSTSVLPNVSPGKKETPNPLPVSGNSSSDKCAENSPRTNKMEEQIESSNKKKQSTNACTTCNKEFPSSQQLRLHTYFQHQLDLESKDPKIKCRECSFESSNQLVLCDHESTHMGLVPLQRLFCLFGQVRQVLRFPKDGSAETK
ncbi:Doublesex- and mab-3-related transcription factor 1 [Frankliniella fusca]|uniref:Doublesex- and mab-3-related transcription factor 1 n=1 Tax=Frankliniella fusca TaxID=407009 RepID=A0AAE1LAU1_9NEOP|nr:Doublesex- and mab-3-related transcription factor 1 [Frankliniella fusca]